MKIEQNIIFTDEDFELLKKELPNNPCIKCDTRIKGYCCGCPQGRDYDISIEPYKNNDILDIALYIKRYKDTLREIKKHEWELTKIRENLPLEIIDKILSQI